MTNFENTIQKVAYPFGPGSRGWKSYISPLLGLLWVAIPTVRFADSGPSAAEVALVVLGLASFGYLYLSRVGRFSADLRTPALGVGGMLVVASTLTLAADEVWGVLYIYSAAAAGLRLPFSLNAVAVVAISGLAAAALALAGAEGATILGIAGTTFGVGALFLLIGSVVRANVALREARAELAELAVAEERLRFARDLHDLLGHDLSLIAVKAELAGRLMPEGAGQAGTEVEDIKALTRSALAQVREAVGGYRRPTLSSELAGARAALEAAGIELRVEDSSAPLDPEVESVLAWAVREGATNAIRHSGARRVAIAVRPAPAEVEIKDDGRGREPEGDARPAGHGLDGLHERARSVGGRVETEAGPEGFRLRVQVPAREVETPA